MSTEKSGILSLADENHEWYAWTQKKLSGNSVHAVNIVTESNSSGKAQEPSCSVPGVTRRK